ncbi:peroxisome biogenesis factor 2-like [Ylistrum balloti]|uniref:peroxisome biogenesis factor 2-like n=1 Tax=Ylistrum balloti TaxID=509963 RepID=UPI002905E34F|nr:peroxisome biogenesis factor 2-like [Ylistrum balloti]
MATTKKDTPIPALRVSQLDAAELDNEVISLIKSQLMQLFKYHQSNTLVKYGPEVDALLKILVWKFSIFTHDCTIGQQILNLRYASENGQGAGPWLGTRQKILYALILIGCPWFKERSDDVLSMLKLSHWKHKVQQLLHWTETGLKVAALINFLVFLRQGVYRALVERILGIRAMFPNQQGVRQVSFEFMTRELLWHGFSEFLFFVLPLINFQRLKNFVMRRVLPVSKPSTDLTSRKLEKCAVCGDNPTNAREISCVHVFCYYCIESNYKADPGFSCPLCGASVADASSIKPVRMVVPTT